MPVRLAKVDKPPLSKRTFALLVPSDCGEKRTDAVQLAVLATMPAQVVEIT